MATTNNGAGAGGGLTVSSSSPVQNKESKSTSGEKKDARKSLSSSVRTREDALKSFRIPPRYVVQDVLGQGAYGIVVSAQDGDTRDIVAVKKIERVFDHETFTKRTLREIRVLRRLKHENIITLKTVFASAKAKDDFDDLYLVFELMETDLANIIKSPQPLTTHHVQFFIYQILRGLKFLHSAGVIHRDIKPRNLLVNSNCDLKICDMGLARFDTGALKGAPPMTDYIATRWYRAPEIILQWEGYGKPIDMWSVGCILAELIGRKPIFPGNEADHQITLICDVLGRPAPALIQRCPHPETIEFLEALARKPSHPLHHIYHQADIVAIDLLTKLLKFDPEKRLTVNECLKHPYLGQLHCPQDEPESSPMNLEADFPFDAVKHMSNEQLLDIVVREVEAHGRFYVDPTFSGARHRPVHAQQQQDQGPRPPSDSPPPFSPPPPSHPPVGSPSFSKKVVGSSSSPSSTLIQSMEGVGKAIGAKVIQGTSKASGAGAATGAAKPSKRTGATGASVTAASRPPPGGSGRSTATTRQYAVNKSADADSLSPALVVHDPIFESSQDSHTPKSPSTPSNVSLELGRLGAAIDELRAM